MEEPECPRLTIISKKTYNHPPLIPFNSRPPPLPDMRRAPKKNQTRRNSTTNFSSWSNTTTKSSTPWKQATNPPNNPQHWETWSPKPSPPSQNTTSPSTPPPTHAPSSPNTQTNKKTATTNPKKWIAKEHPQKSKDDISMIVNSLPQLNYILCIHTNSTTSKRY